MNECKYDNCTRPGKRARGLCATHWNLEQYGPCINGCRVPANNKTGLCPACWRRGGKAPQRRNIGWIHNSDEQTWCNVCKTVQPKSNFTSHKNRCNVCQSARKARAYQAKRNGLYGWQQEHVLQTSLGQCCKCRKDLDGPGHLDHIVPESLGGTLDNDNVQVLCSWCNQSKGNREAVDYRIFLHKGVKMKSEYGALTYNNDVTEYCQPGVILGHDQDYRPYEVVDAEYNPETNKTEVQIQYFNADA